MIRAILLTIFILGSVGSGAELLLLNHVESLLQWIPLLLILLSFVALGWHARRGAPLRALAPFKVRWSHSSLLALRDSISTTRAAWSSS